MSDKEKDYGFDIYAVFEDKTQRWMDRVVTFSELERCIEALLNMFAVKEVRIVKVEV